MDTPIVAPAVKSRGNVVHADLLTLADARDERRLAPLDETVDYTHLFGTGASPRVLERTSIDVARCQRRPCTLHG